MRGKWEKKREEKGRLEQRKGERKTSQIGNQPSLGDTAISSAYDFLLFIVIIFKKNKGRKKEKEKRSEVSIARVKELGRVFHARAEADLRVRVPEPLGVLHPHIGFADPPGPAAEAGRPASARSLPAPPPSFPGRSLRPSPTRPAVSSAGPSDPRFGGPGVGKPAFPLLGGGGLAARTRLPAGRAAVPWSATSLRKLALRGHASRPPAPNLTVPAFPQTLRAA